MKKLLDQIDKKIWLLLIASFVISVVFMLFASPYTTPLNEYYGFDSAVFMVLGRGLAEGKLPYLELYDNKGPMIFLVDALGWMMGGRLGLFFLQCIFMTFVLALAYRLVRLFADRSWAWLGLAVFAFLYCGTVGEGNMTEEWSLLFTLLPLYMALRYLRSGRRIAEHPLWYSLIYGLCMGVQFMFRVTNAFPLCGMILAFLILLIREKGFKALWLNALVVLGGIVIVVAPFVVYYKAVGAYDLFIYATLLHNFSYATGGAAAKTLADWLYMAARISMTPAVIVLSVILVRKKRLACSEAVLIGCVSVLGAFAMCFGYSYKHYFLLLAPAILASFGLCLEGICRSGLEKGRERLACLLLALFCVLPYAPQSAIHAGKSILFNFCGYLDSDVASMREIDSYITDHRDSVWGYDVKANMYMYLDVVPCFRYFTTQSWMAQDTPFMQTEIEEMLETDPPYWILTDGSPELREWITGSYDYELAAAVDEGLCPRLYRYTGK